MKTVVLYIDCMRVGCPATYENSGVIPRLHEGRVPATYEKMVFYLDCMRVGCPATYEKSGVLPRLHEGRVPSNI
jgi:hypothetical protein